MTQKEIDKIIDKLKYQYWNCHDEHKAAQLEWELDYFYWFKEKIST